MTTRIINFCGGRGSKSITTALLDQPGVWLTNIVNAYDDGKSTGVIRDVFQMLGPSDIRKNYLTMMPDTTDQDAALRSLFSYRFPKTISHDEAVQTLEALLAGQPDVFGLHTAMSAIDSRRRDGIRRYLQYFLEKLRLYEQVRGEQFPYEDCSVANCALAGAFEAHGRNFDLAVDQFGRLLATLGETIINSDQNRYLVAILENGCLLNSEAEIVEARTDERIHDIYLLETPLSVTERQNLDRLPLVDKVNFLQSRSTPPHATRRCLEAIQGADIILYSPGTQYSSLYPSYLTWPIGQAIRRNERALKVFVANLVEDNETPDYSASELVAGALLRLRSSDRGRDYPTRYYIHFVLANNGFIQRRNSGRYIHYNSEEVEKLGVSCLAADFEDPQAQGRHNGVQVVSTIFELLDCFDQNGNNGHCPHRDQMITLEGAISDQVRHQQSQETGVSQAYPLAL